MTSDLLKKMENETFLLELNYFEFFEILKLLDLIRNLSNFSSSYSENENVYNSIRNKLGISQEEVFYSVKGGNNEE